MSRTFTFNDVQDKIIIDSLNNYLNNHLLNENSDKDYISEIKYLLSLYKGTLINEHN